MSDEHNMQPDLANEFVEPEHIGLTGTEAEVKAESTRRTRRAFLVGGLGAAAGYGLYRATDMGPVIGQQPLTFRRTFQADAKIMRNLFGERGLSPTYPLSRAETLRFNGSVGLDQEIKPEGFRLQVVGTANPRQHPRFAPDVTAWNYDYGDDMKPDSQMTDVKSAPGNALKSEQKKEDAPDPPAPTPAVKANTLNPTGAVDSAAGAALAAHIQAMMQESAEKPHQGDAEAGPSASGLDRNTPGLLLTLDDLRKLPFVEHVTQFRCIEGWSQIVHWGGYRMADFLEAYPPAKIDGHDPKFVYMETPDGDYYGGYNMNAMRHPQTLLVTHIGGQPISQAHGAPIRLFTPIKYGYKNIKRVGLISYSNTKPDDYWTKLGYDWYAGL